MKTTVSVNFSVVMLTKLLYNLRVITHYQWLACDEVKYASEHWIIIHKKS